MKRKREMTEDFWETERIRGREYWAKLKQDKIRYEKTLERQRAYLKTYKRLNPRKYKSKNSRGIKMRFTILLRDMFTCQYCGRSAPEVKLHVDHIIPRSKGGATVEDNLRTSCQDCNLGKSDMLIV